jgi:hypothetical protein
MESTYEEKKNLKIRNEQKKITKLVILYYFLFRIIYINLH